MGVEKSIAIISSQENRNLINALKERFFFFYNKNGFYIITQLESPIIKNAIKEEHRFLTELLSDNNSLECLALYERLKDSKKRFSEESLKNYYDYITMIHYKMK